MNMLWYAAYGSNVNRERFLEYIHGGKSAFNGQTYSGCRDKREPIRDYAMMINRELYFAKNSDPWGGAVAFVLPESSKSQTLGRAYLISEEQFVDIAAQENARRIGEKDFGFSYQYAEKSPESYLNATNPSVPLGGGKLWYGRVLRLGTRESWPIFTLTAEWAGYQDINAPGRTYLRTVASGIRQLGRISPKSLVEYFITKAGIKDRISRPVLDRWLV
jgi:hypothetical protein